MALKTEIEATAAEEWVGMTLGELARFVDAARGVKIALDAPVELVAHEIDDYGMIRTRIGELRIKATS